MLGMGGRRVRDCSSGIGTFSLLGIRGRELALPDLTSPEKVRFPARKPRWRKGGRDSRRNGGFSRGRSRPRHLGRGTLDSFLNYKGRQATAPLPRKNGCLADDNGVGGGVVGKEGGTVASGRTYTLLLNREKSTKRIPWRGKFRRPVKLYRPFC